MLFVKLSSWKLDAVYKSGQVADHGGEKKGKLAGAFCNDREY
jgi:hypothetical protein